MEDLQQMTALIANLAAVVRVQNGSNHSDINTLLAHADKILSRANDAPSSPGVTMLKVNVYSADGNRQAKWDGSIIQVSRVPCVGEYVRVNSSTPAQRVVRVIHNIKEDIETVAGLTLDVE